MRFFKPIKWQAGRWLLTIRFSSVVTRSQPIFTMRVLIFTLLAVAVSAANYGYDSYYGGGGYPSYSSSYYGGGYGSSLYGAGYGSGASYGLGGSGWSGGLGSYTTAYKPALYQTARYSSRQPPGTEAVYRSGYSPAPGKIEFILGNSGYRTPTHNPLPKRSGIHVGVQEPVEDVSQILLHEKADLTGSRFGGISSQAALPKPFTGSHGFKEVHKTVTHTSGSAGPQVSFVRETTKVTDITGSRPNIHAYDKVSAPLGATVLAKIPSRAGGTTGTLPKSETDPPRISFTRDFSKVDGHSEQIDAKPEIHGTDSISSAGVEVAERPESDQDVGAEHKSETHGISDADERGEADFTDVSGLGIGEVKPSVSSGRLTTSGVSALPRPSSGSVHKSGFHGISSAEGPQITFIQGTSTLHRSGIKTSSFDKIAAPRRPSYGSRVTEVQHNIPAPAFPAAGPSRITFTQDFSRVSGHQASQGYQGARRFTSSTSAKRPAAASKQPVADQPSFTAVYEQGRTHGVFPVRSDGSVAGDKSIFADSHFANVEEQDGVKFSNFVVVGKSSAFAGAGGKVSGIRHSVVGTRDPSQLVVPSPGEAVDRENVFVAIPVEDYGQDKSSVILHSTGVFPVGSLVEEKGSTFKFSPGAHSLLSKQGQSQGYSTTTTPFKSYYSSSYPGYSHVSGESPRFDFSPDRSLLYAYNSPHLVSPFSYSYTSGSKYYGGGSRKTIGQ